MGKTASNGIQRNDFSLDSPKNLAAIKILNKRLSNYLEWCGSHSSFFCVSLLKEKT